MCKLPDKPNSPEEVYAEDDEVYGWAVYGLESGFCYCQPQGGQGAAEAKADEMNKRYHEYISDKKTLTAINLELKKIEMVSK